MNKLYYFKAGAKKSSSSYNIMLKTINDTCKTANIIFLIDES